MKDGQEIEASWERYDVSADGVFRRLVIREATAEDSGSFSCKLGNNVTTAQVAVEGKNY